MMQSAATILEDLKSKNFCRVTGQLKLTKTNSNFSDVLISRDRELENQTIAWIKSRIDIDTLFSRYKVYDDHLKDFSWPQHYPVRILSGAGSACSGNNIFMFFPNVLNQAPQKEEDVFGLEFIDVWANIFKNVVFPLANRIFNKETLIKLLPLQQNLEKTIYLAAAFHEIGHRCGPYRVSPSTFNYMKLDPYLLDIMGELSTDSLLVNNLPEFPEIIQFVILQRLFWFGRKGFKHDPISAELNTDNDAWLGSLLWQQLLNQGCLNETNGRYDLDFKKSYLIFSQLTTEIDSLIHADQNKVAQNQEVRMWMKKKIPNTFDTFVLPETFRVVLEDLQDIEEVPHFQAPYSYSHIEALSGAIQNEKFN